MRSSRHGIIFPAGQDLEADSDGIAIRVYHPDHPEKSIRVADKNLAGEIHRTEPEPEKPIIESNPTTIVEQMALF
jgi:hypothetical protein